MRALAVWGDKRLASIAYLDAPEFEKFVERDAKRLETAVKKIGKVEEK